MASPVVIPFFAVATVRPSGATVARPYVNFRGAAADDRARAGYQALERGDNQAAAEAYGRAAAARPEEASSWYNLGIAWQRLELPELRGVFSAFLLSHFFSTARRSGSGTRPRFTTRVSRARVCTPRST